jgi:hypothetical protein
VLQKLAIAGAMESARDGTSEHVRQKVTDKRKKENNNNNKAGAGEAVLLGALAGGVNVKLHVSISPFPLMLGVIICCDLQHSF